MVVDEVAVAAEVAAATVADEAAVADEAIGAAGTKPMGPPCSRQRTVRKTADPVYRMRGS